MTETWYEASNYGDRPPRAVQVESRTAKQVVINGRRNLIDTEGTIYRQNYAEARQWMIDKARERRDNAVKRLEYANRDLARIEAIPERPTP